MRKQIYTQLYGYETYPWVATKSSQNPDFTPGADWEDNELEPSSSAVSPAAPPRPTHKGYVPPTPVNSRAARPFGKVLDAPLG